MSQKGNMMFLSDWSIDENSSIDCGLACNRFVCGNCRRTVETVTDGSDSIHSNHIKCRRRAEDLSRISVLQRPDGADSSQEFWWFAAGGSEIGARRVG